MKVFYLEDEKLDLVSVIIPTYNREIKIVNRAIKSTLNQTYKKLEIIIVDDNIDDKISSDLKLLINKFDDNRIIYHKNKKYRRC